MKKKITAIFGAVMLSVAMLPVNAYAYWTAGFEVVVNGNSIGIVKSSNVVDYVLNNVNEELKLEYGNSEIITPDIQLRAKLVASEKLTDYETLHDGIAAESDKMVTALRINVDGTDTVYIEDSDEMVKSLDIVVEKLGVDGLKSEIIQIVGCEETVVPSKKVMDSDSAAQFFIDNDIITVRSTAVSKEEAEYIAPDVEVPNGKLYEGDREVVKEAVPGKKNVITTTYYVNGQEAEEKVTEEVIDKGIPATVYVGTKKRPSDVGTGRFKYPTDGRLTSEFGPRWGRFHYGIDLASPTGTPVFASDNGVVTFAGEKGSFGKIVMIDHNNGYETYYAHNSEILVSEGEIVEQGQMIAKVGVTGRTTGPHCHFEVHVDGVAQNPLDYLEK